MRLILIPVLALTSTVAMAQYREQGPAPAIQYRDDQPEVLRPAPPPVPAGVISAGAFRAAYARAGRPRILVFWNRVFSDEVSSTYRDTLHAQATTEHSANAQASNSVGWFSNSADVQGASSTRSTLDVSVGQERDTSARDNALSENVDFSVESAFTDALAQNGAQLIDRSLAMRTARGAKGAGSAPNVQAIETEAATSRANLLIEVLQSPAPGTPTGAVFKVTVKDIRAARVLASFTTAGRGAYVKPPLVAGPGGFVRALPQGTSPDGVGQEIANQTMAALARSLR